MAEATSEARREVKKELDFEKVERLRKHMRISIEAMTQLLGVSRVTYYAWMRGARPRSEREDKVRKRLRRLAWAVTEKNWPTIEALRAKPKDRYIMLLNLLNSFEN